MTKAKTSYKESNALISMCGTYRYVLTRTWDGALKRCVWIMLNPSTADANHDDATIRRCVGFAKQWGYGGIIVVNLFAVRATNPIDMKDHPKPHGAANDDHIREVLANPEVDRVVCAWGNHGSWMKRDQEVLKLVTDAGRDPMILGSLTKEGNPAHPLYQPANTWLMVHPHVKRATPEADMTIDAFGCTNNGCVFHPDRDFGTMGWCQCLKKPGAYNAVKKLIERQTKARVELEDLLVGFAETHDAIDAGGGDGADIEEHKAHYDAVLERGRRLREARQ